MSEVIAAYHEKQKSVVATILLRTLDTHGVAKLYHDRIEVWRNGNLVGRARNLDDALRRAINAERAEWKRERIGRR